MRERIYWNRDWEFTTEFKEELLEKNFTGVPACASSSLAFLMMYSVYKLNKQGDTLQP